MAIPRRAISRAVLSCAWLGRPEAFLKIVRFMPIALALRVIFFAKLRSFPPRCSETTVATSFADFVTKARMAFSTVMVWPGFRYNFEGDLLAATLLTFMRVPRVMRRFWRASNSRYKVIILVSDAGKSCLSALRE